MLLGKFAMLIRPYHSLMFQINYKNSEKPNKWFNFLQYYNQFLLVTINAHKFNSTQLYILTYISTFWQTVQDWQNPPYAVFNNNNNNNK